MNERKPQPDADEEREYRDRMIENLARFFRAVLPKVVARPAPTPEPESEPCTTS